ncbi:ER-phagy receptor 1 [Castilleja foliolosa]|uniref:ER-phagy receptor 1 n=1 Tax=Castilleja foliolosa TaxID=1961234 RepID=A0ABD3DKS2_9LAMI
MVAEAKDQTEDAMVLIISQFDSSANKSNHSLSSGGYGYALKVRKPYTITKQRERWTEQEHHRFLEALKLYGRAWRQIEGHVGTKTAIQIRSHAQKFFAKVTKDPCADVEGSLNPIEIPPPRPKRKPLHPYPRKTVYSANIENAVPRRVDRLNDVTVSGRDNYSPTSVFSAIGSIAETHKSRLSPASCVADDALSAKLLAENDNEQAASNASSKVENGFRLPVNKSWASIPDNKPTMKFELFPQEAESSPCTGESYTSIKLFGKTVVIKDTRKNNGSVMPGPVYNPYSSGEDKIVENDENTPQEGSNDEEFQREGSLVGSNSGSMCEANADNRYSDVESRHMLNCGNEKMGKGFVPYKRCLAERDEKSSLSFMHGRESQRARVCS